MDGLQGRFFSGNPICPHFNGNPLSARIAAAIFKDLSVEVPQPYLPALPALPTTLSSRGTQDAYRTYLPYGQVLAVKVPQPYLQHVPALPTPLSSTYPPHLPSLPTALSVEVPQPYLAHLPARPTLLSSRGTQDARAIILQSDLRFLPPPPLFPFVISFFLFFWQEVHDIIETVKAQDIKALGVSKTDPDPWLDGVKVCP